MGSAEKTPLNPLDNCLLLYEQLLEPKSQQNSENNFAFWFEIDESYIKKHYTFDVDNSIPLKSILKVSETIYLHPSFFRIIFRNEREKLFAISDSKRNLKTKLINKYINQFITVEQEPSLEIIPFSEHLHVKDVSLDQKSLDKDIKLNRLKGFLYAYVYGQLNNFPKEITLFSNQLNLVIQQFSIIITDVEIGTDRKSTKRINPDTTHKKIRSLQEKISALKKIRPFINLMLDENFSLRLNNAVKKIGKNYSMESFSEILEVLAGKFFSQFLVNLKTNAAGLSQSFDDTIYDLISISEELKNAQFYEIKSIKESLEESINSLQLLLEKCREMSTPTVTATLLKRINITSEGKISGVKSEAEFDHEIYLVFLNKLLSDYNQFPTNDIKAKKVEIIEEFGLVCKDFEKDDWNSKNEERQYLLELLETLKGRAYKFDLAATNNLLVQSAASVALENECLLPLNQLLDSVNNQDKSVAMGIWGAIAGFSAMNKTMYEDFEVKASPELIKSIDNYVIDLLQSIDWSKKADYNLPKSTTLTMADAAEQNDVPSDLIEKAKPPPQTESITSEAKPQVVETEIEQFAAHVVQKLMSTYPKWNKANNNIIKEAVLYGHGESIDKDMFDETTTFIIDEKRLKNYLAEHKREKPLYKDNDIIRIIYTEWKTINSR